MSFGSTLEQKIPDLEEWGLDSDIFLKLFQWLSCTTQGGELLIQAILKTWMS